MVIILIVLVFVMPPISVFQGGGLCRFSSSRAFPRNVQSAFAIFENLDTVEVKRCGEDSLDGDKIPRMLIFTAYTVDSWKSWGGGGYLVGSCSLIVRMSVGPNIPMSKFNYELRNVSAWLRAIIFGPKQKRFPQLKSLNVDNHVVELGDITKFIAVYIYQLST